ncbi:MAG: branched-chain amino acid ABC transporter permease [Actinomycetota bacterium]|nr:branched-chain amino acid ABC transporter permease [Actinomycetota bacterium]
MEILLTLVGFGIVSGAVAAVPALGLTLMYGSSRFINFAYGEWMTLAAFLTLSLSGVAPLWLASAGAILVVALYGPLANRVVFRPLADRHGLVLLVTSLGLSFVMQNAIRAIWGVSVRRLETPSALGRGITFGPLRFTPLQLIILGVALLVMAGAAYLLLRTDLGMKIRAAAENRELARVTGIRVERISALTWGLASALAALGGIMVALTASFTPSLGFTLLLIVASAMILGGMGSPVGAVVGALILGVAMEVSTIVISGALKPAVAFATLAAVLLVEPSGLLGRRA